MRWVVLLAATSAIALSLAGCDKGGGSGSQSEAAPSAPTPTQAQAMVASLPAPFNTADLANGESKFQACRACHTTDQGGPNMVGPNLWGVFGRKAGSVPEFNYSDGLKASGLIWDAPTIAKWITAPRTMVPDTRMSFPGLPEAKDRTDLVAYLKTVTSSPPAS